MRVFASVTTYPTCHRAVNVHEVRVLVALPLVLPMIAVLGEVRTLGRAQTTGGCTFSVHVGTRYLALPTFRPIWAVAVSIRTRQWTHATAMWAEILDNVVGFTQAFARPAGARNVFVVAIPIEAKYSNPPKRMVHRSIEVQGAPSVTSLTQ